MIEIKYWNCAEISATAKEVDDKLWIVAMALPWSPKIITMNRDEVQKYIDAIAFAKHTILPSTKEVFEKRVEQVSGIAVNYPYDKPNELKP